MIQDVRAGQARPLTGRAVLAMMVGFFAVVATVNAVMIALAVDTLPGTVTDSAYRSSQRFNAELAAARTRAAGGMAAAAHVERLADGSARLDLTLRDGEGRAFGASDVVARLVRPLEPRADRSFSLSAAGAGRLAGTAQDVAQGAYDLVVEARDAGRLVFRSRDRVVLP